MRPALLFGLLLLPFLIWAQAPDKELVIEEGWFYQEQETTDWFPAKVPGNVHGDLLRNEQIEDPYFQNNEQNVQYLEQKNWVYKCTFPFPKSLEAYHQIDLVFEGLDTYAFVYLNGEKLLSADNMFRKWTLPVKNLLKEENELKIIFDSPTKQGKALLADLGYRLPTNGDTSYASVFTRKAPYQYGWDWGPRLTTSGVWKPVKLVGWNEVRIENAAVLTQDVREASAQMELRFDVFSRKAIKKIEIVWEGIQKTISLKKGANEIVLPFTVKDPNLWWCNGQGEPHLYQKELILKRKQKLLAATKIQYGIRTVELVQEKDEIGASYYFKLNGRKVFMKGANVIPFEALPGEVNPDYKQWILESAVEANMNMLRVWGGGVYQTDDFYEFCDKNGLLVWQDFMFACSMYPGDPAFLANVKQEAKEQVKRIRKHPSLAVFCGNNEIEVAWNNWGWQKQYELTGTQADDIWKTYQKLFLAGGILESAVKNHADPTFYVSTSPLSNWGKLENFNSSSMHYWGVWHSSDTFEDYQKFVGRFMSEYGFQSLPSMKSIKTFTLEEDRSMDSEVMTFRQKSYRGNKMFADHMPRYFKEAEDFEKYVYLNQLTQAHGIGLAISAHRLKKPHCMGTLYWQLNDCYPAFSWSSIDYAGEWKALHYKVKHHYDQVLIDVLPKGDSLEVKVASDFPREESAFLEIKLLDFSGKEHWKHSEKIFLDPAKSPSLKWLSKNELAKLTSLESAYLKLSIEVKEKKYETLYFCNAPKDLELPASEISVVWKDKSSNVLLVKASAFAKNAFLSHPGNVHFGNNYLDLEAGRSYEIKIKGEVKDREAWLEKLEVFSLGDLK